MKTKIILPLIAFVIIAGDLIAQNQLVTIDQRNSNNQQVGVLKKWEGSYWSNPFNPGSQFYFPVGSQQTLLGAQTMISNQKYNNWNEDFSNVKNHQEFLITPFTNDLTSWFEPTHTGITIQTNLEGTGLNSGVVEFRDPWFIDYQDGQYANQLRNRGMGKVGVLQKNFG